MVLSRIDVHDATEGVTERAAALLRDHRLRHEYAGHAVLAAVTRSAPGRQGVTAGEAPLRRPGPVGPPRTFT
ncbi:hypothetical protein QFZ66_003960 [Streptomyces sp. B4I13]|nr:hypothetical protein [Streptomyces sp. B4I13]